MIFVAESPLSQFFFFFSISEDLEDNVITEVITRELPDSITTWSFLAVGLSANRGVCVSNPLDQTVQKLFYAEVRLPFKAVRLEEVKVKITVHNHHSYSLTVSINIFMYL